MISGSEQMSRSNPSYTMERVVRAERVISTAVTITDLSVLVVSLLILLHRLPSQPHIVGWGGGLSEHVVVPRKAVYEVPDNVSLEVAGKYLLCLPILG